MQETVFVVLETESCLGLGAKSNIQIATAPPINQLKGTETLKQPNQGAVTQRISPTRSRQQFLQPSWKPGDPVSPTFSPFRGNVHVLTLKFKASGPR